VVSPDGTAELVDLPAGPPLGLGGLPFEAAEIDLAEGSLLALYTDGLVESRDRDIDEGGRGLLLVAQPTQHWGTRQTTKGKTIWAEQTLEPTPSGHSP
jgi:hypothetical protein